MALSPSHFKEKYKNCSVEELESRFNELRKEVEFKTKKEFLKHCILVNDVKQNFNK